MKRIIGTALAVCLAAGACAPLRVAGPTGTIEAKALLGRERVAGARVFAGPEPGVDGSARSAVTGPDGECRLAVPPGSHFLWYRKNPDLFGYFGGNPVTVSEGLPSTVSLRGVRGTGRTRFHDAGFTGLEGTATLDGAPLAGATVQVFLDASGGFRGPGYAVATSDAGGRFVLDLPAGRYFLLGRKRSAGGRIGPLHPGDRYAFFPGNPLYLKEGTTALIDLPFVSVEKDPILALAEASRASLVEGRVHNARGEGIPGVFACLYLDPEPMGAPAYVSEATGDDGRFVLRVTVPGSYYLVARGGIGRPLEQGEYVAFWRGPAGHRVDVEPEAGNSGITILWEGK